MYNKLTKLYAACFTLATSAWPA